MTITLKIQLRGITKPPVWRRIEIPAKLTFHDLHLTIQMAFGWKGFHLFQFQKQPYDQGWQVTMPDDDGQIDAWEGYNAKATVVGDFLEEKMLTKFVYIYDFGDDWFHDITVERRDAEATLLHPVCLAGKGACPPEDCGGKYGYEELKEMLTTSPDDSEARNFAEWMGLKDPREFDPNAFDLTKVNALLGTIKASKPKKGGKRAQVKELSGNDPDEHFRNFQESLELFSSMLRDVSYLVGDDEDLSKLSPDELDAYLDDYDDDDDYDFFDDYIEGYYIHSVPPKRYELMVRHGSDERLLQLPSNLTLSGVAVVVAKAFGLKEMPEHYEMVADDGFRYLPDADDHALDADYWRMDGTDYSSLHGLVRGKGYTAQFKLMDGEEVSDTFLFTLQKNGRYTDKTPKHITLLDGTGDGIDEARKIVEDFGEANPLPKD